jgi:GxxExxY protein
MTENEIAKQIVDAAFKIHTTLGPGLLESVYEAVMNYELQNAAYTWIAKCRLRLFMKHFALRKDFART